MLLDWLPSVTLKEFAVSARNVETLAKLNAPDIGKILIQALTNDDFVIRTYAAENIGELKVDGAVEPLIAAFKRAQNDAPYSARAAALAALAKYGAQAAGPTLQTALGDKDWAVRVRAAELLKTLDPSVETAHAIRPAPTGRPVRSDVGMTGEVTLNGRVLPIGGVKQKLLAAHRAGLTTVFLPKRNEPDLDDVPASVREQLDVRLVSDVANLVREALEPAQEAALVA